MASSISYTIPGVILMNQLVEASNPRDDCVFTSSAAIATWRSGGSPRYIPIADAQVVRRRGDDNVD